MKTFLIILILMTPGCANTRFVLFGIDVAEMSRKDFGSCATGAIASVATHITGHYLAAEIFDMDIHQDGLMEIVADYDNHSQSELRWFARGGFVLQLAVNTLLTTVAKDSYFTKGFTAATFSELITYKLRREEGGDFAMIDHENGKANQEYGLYIALATYNLLRVSWQPYSQSEQHSSRSR